MKGLLRISLASVAAAAAAYLAYQRPTVVYSQNLPSAQEGQQFRIVFGLTDSQPRTWNGRISATGGEIVSLEGWRSDPKDHASADGSFAFTTKIGLLEDQTRPGSYFGQTGYDNQSYQHLIPQGLLLKLRGGGTATVRIESAAGSFAFQTDQIGWGARFPFLDGNASVERLPMEAKISSPGAADDYPAMALAPDGKRWIAWLSFREKSDKLLVSDGARVYEVGESGDLQAPSIASDGHGGMQVVWARNRNSAFHLFAARFSNGAWSRAEALTGAGGSNFWPQLASDGAGRMALVWQSLRNGQSAIFARLWDGRRWGAERRISEGRGNCWSPVAAYGGGRLWMAWDSYDTGAYQVYVREWSRPVARVTKGDQFSVRPSLAVSRSGQPVIAWEESDSLWGKDFAYIVDRRGTVEYKNRRVRVAYLDSGEWKEPPASVADAIPREIRRYVQQPQLAMDGDGRLYLSVRARTSTRVSRIDYWANNGRWETLITWLDGDHWAPAIPMPASVGRNGMRAVLAPDRRQIHVVWPTDGRLWTSGRYEDLDIYAAALPVSADPARLENGKVIEAAPAAANPNPAETEDLRRMRDYRYRVNGKNYRILRGDFHRHTELSGDGAGDGMLEDNYRYTLDAAGMDIGFVSDHQMGQDEEYNWWITQKWNDLYYMPRRFVPMYGYERSVPYPNGHRNVMWADRGKPVLRIAPEELQGKVNTGSVLYPYARETQAIVFPHSTATAQGTDWRDNDPALEPVVEIYQGYDANYEEADAPRAWKPGQTQAHQGQERSGFVWNAWAKGYKLGVQSSSDHISTHTSYSCVLAEEFTRQGILDAIRKRHTYAATDNIVMDFRIANTSAGEALMGDVVPGPAAPRLVVHVIGTAPLKTIDVIKNNKYVHQLSPNQKEVRFEYLDNEAASAESYYYIRAEQTDGQLAWSSPIWIQHGSGR
jgi:hypothetical protein